MDISIKNEINEVQYHFLDRRDIRETFNGDEFENLSADLQSLAKTFDMEYASNRTDLPPERFDNNNRVKHMGGGYIVYKTIRLLLVSTGAMTALIKFIKALSPIIEKYIEKRSGRGITIKTNSIEITVSNRKDLAEAVAQIEKISAMEKNKDGSAKSETPKPGSDEKTANTEEK